MDSLKKILFITGIIVIIGSNIWKIYRAEDIKPTEKQLMEVIPNPHRIEKGEKNPEHYKGFLPDKKEDMVGVAYLTTHIEPAVKGYVSEIDILVGMDTQGKITGVKLLHHEETPSYMNTVLELNFLESFIGLNVQDGFSHIDTVTSATISSQAIRDDISSSSARIARLVLGLSIPEEKKGSKIDNFLKQDVIVFSCILLFATLSFLLKRYKVMRDLSLIASILGLGIYYNTFLYLGNITNLLSFQFPSYSNPNLFVLLIYVLITTPILGPVFCSHLCPFGSMQELIYRFFPERWQVSHELWKKYSIIRYFLLWICVLAVFGLDMESFNQVEPFPYLFSWLKGTGIGSMFIYIGGVLAVSALFNRFYCRIFCPTGVCLSILAMGRRGQGARGRNQEDNV